MSEQKARPRARVEYRLGEDGEPTMVNVGIEGLRIGSDVELAGLVADELSGLHGEVVHSEGEFWRFDGTRWVVIPETEIRLICHRYDGAPFGTKMTIRLGKNRINSILNELAAILEQRDFFANVPLGINCAAGFIAFENGEPTLLPHAPDYRCRHVLQGRWPINPALDVVRESLLSQLLRGCFLCDDDAEAKIHLLAEIAGAAALGYATRLRKPKAVVLVGTTAENGKSQILDLLRGLLPASAISSLPLGKFDEDRYVVQLAGKLLNASDELTSAAAIPADAFKRIITGEPTMGRDVYRNALTFRPIAQHVFATNDLPSFRGGMDRGVLRRLLVITFNRMIPEDERKEHIGQRIAHEEADLLLDFAVQGASRLIKRRYFEEPASSTDALNEWLIGADPVVAWLEEAVAIVAGMDPPKVQIGTAYGRFREWAVAQGYAEATLPSVKTFVQRVVNAGGTRGVGRRRDSKGRYLTGIMLDKLSQQTAFSARG